MNKDELKNDLIQSSKGAVRDGQKKFMKMLRATTLLKELELDHLHTTPQHVVGRKKDIYLLMTPNVAGIYVLKFKTLEKSSIPMMRVPKCHLEFKETINNYYVSRWDRDCTIPITIDQYVTGQAMGYFLLLGDTFDVSSASEDLFKVITKLQEEDAHSIAVNERVNLFQGATSINSDH
ncbi:MAG: hypothetical protein ACFFCZ_00350 [Promethearchaeota archaeon]